MGFNSGFKGLIYRDANHWTAVRSCLFTAKINTMLETLHNDYRQGREGMAPRSINVGNATGRVVSFTIRALLTGEGAVGTHRISGSVCFRTGRNNMILRQVPNWKSNSGILSDSQFLCRLMHYGSLII